MSGHSKWSKVKHQKAVTDVVKGTAFTKASRAIAIAVIEGGGVVDPDMNFHLRLAIEKARQVNMPKENITRAIERAKGSGGASLEHVLYEAYGPGGAAIIIEAATNNRQRTVSAVKNIVERAGGRLAEPGSVMYLFTRQGVLFIDKHGLTKAHMEEAAIESGADDVVESDATYEFYTKGGVLQSVKDALIKLGIEPQSVDFVMRPSTLLTIGERERVALARLVMELEGLDDIANVCTNIA